MKKLSLFLVLVTVVFSFTSCNNENENITPPNTLVDIAVQDSRFSILVAALQKADLVTVLQGQGPFTVFAPTNDAFIAAGITSVDNLTREQLAPILLAHVVPARVAASQVQPGAVTTAGNSEIFFSVNNQRIFINGNVEVVSADINASNGILHVINNVIIPPTQSIVDIAVNNPNFSTLVDLVTRAGLAQTLSGGNFTVFAPTNAAFEALRASGVDPNALTPAQLTSILLYHVVPGRVFSTDLMPGNVTTAAGGQLRVDLGTGVRITGQNSEPSNVVLANVLATNGVIHAIDRVLIP